MFQKFLFYCPTAQMAEFMFQNVAYRATVYRTGVKIKLYFWQIFDKFLTNFWQILDKYLNRFLHRFLDRFFDRFWQIFWQSYILVRFRIEVDLFWFSLVLWNGWISKWDFFIMDHSGATDMWLSQQWQPQGIPELLLTFASQL